jgi:hypothetical protein
VDKYGIICFEDLNIKNMVRDPLYAKGIMDAAWSKLGILFKCHGFNGIINILLALFIYINYLEGSNEPRGSNTKFRIS